MELTVILRAFHNLAGRVIMAKAKKAAASQPRFSLTAAVGVRAEWQADGLASRPAAQSTFVLT